MTVAVIGPSSEPRDAEDSPGQGNNSRGDSGFGTRDSELMSSDQGLSSLAARAPLPYAAAATATPRQSISNPPFHQRRVVMLGIKERAERPTRSAREQAAEHGVRLVRELRDD